MKPKISTATARDMTALALQHLTPGEEAERFIKAWSSALPQLFDISEHDLDKATGQAWAEFQQWHRDTITAKVGAVAVSILEFLQAATPNQKTTRA